MRQDVGEPEYGPGGYLPERAARRARKIVLREQMGLGWPLAAVAAGLLLLAVGVAYLLTRTGPPGPPYVAATPIAAVDPRGAAVVAVPGFDRDVLVVRAAGAVRVFALPQGVEPTFCPASRRLEDGRQVWDLTGRRVGGQARSLHPVPSQVFDEVLYVSADPATWPQPPPPVGDDARPACGTAQARTSGA